MSPAWTVDDIDADLCRLNDLLNVICAIQFERAANETDDRIDCLLWIAREISDGIVDYHNRKHGLSADEVLSTFDLVTEGTFQGSKYFVIRFWGGLSPEGLQNLARKLGGHIVAINSQAENDFVYNLSLKQKGHWVLFESPYGPQSSGPIIGLVQAPGSHEPDGGWSWLNGDPLDFTAWTTNAPENSEGIRAWPSFALTASTRCHSGTTSRRCRNQ